MKITDKFLKNDSDKEMLLRQMTREEKQELVEKLGMLTDAELRKFNINAELGFYFEDFDLVDKYLCEPKEEVRGIYFLLMHNGQISELMDYLDTLPPEEKEHYLLKK